MNIPQPKHLSAEARTWWKAVLEQYDLADTDLRLLRLAAEAWDRGQAARRVLQEKGLTYLDPKRGPRMRPEVVIQRDASTLFARLVAQLGLDAAEPSANQTRRKSETYWPRWKKDRHGTS